MTFLIIQCFGHACIGQNIDFDILKGQKKVEIPFEFRNNFIVVKVKMQGVIPLNFIFDTGAQHTLLFKKIYTDLLGHEYDRRIPILGSDLDEQLYALVCRKVRIDIPGLLTFNRDILVLEEDFFRLDEMTGMYIDGLLGIETFKNNVVEVDYVKRVITVSNPKTFRPPTRKATKIPVSITDGKPYLNAQVTLSDEAKVKVTLLMDTGAGIPMLLYTNTHPDLKLPDETIIGKLGKGLGGYLEGYLGRVTQIDIHDVKFRNLIISFQEIDSLKLVNASIERNGILGNQILSRFDVTLDLVNNYLYLVPNRFFRDKFSFDRSGLVIFAVGHNLNEYLINSVIKKSPAELAGVQPGDLIKKVNGIPSAFFSLGDITRILKKKVGKKIKLVLIRDGERIKKEFRLRDLI